MLKFTIISCIIAVCINFHKAEAVVFTQNSLELLLNNTQDQFLNALKNIIEHGSESLQNLEREAVKVGENSDESLVTQVPTKTSEAYTTEVDSSDISACSTLYDKGYAAFNELISIFTTCLLNETRSAIEGKNLISFINNLENNIPEKAQSILQCFKNPLTLPCLAAIIQNFDELLPTIEQGTQAIFEFASIFPNIRPCYQKMYLQLTQNYLFTLLNDVEQCIQSIVQRFI